MNALKHWAQLCVATYGVLAIGHCTVLKIAAGERALFQNQGGEPPIHVIKRACDNILLTDSFMAPFNAIESPIPSLILYFNEEKVNRYSKSK
jgi:hypothetical protein